MVSVYTEVEVDVELDEFDTQDLLDELERRNLGFSESSVEGRELIRHIFEKRRLGKDYQKELDHLIYLAIGRIA